MSDRTPCLNPECRRTGARDKFPGIMLCGKCWKALPKVMRDRWKTLNARSRKLDRINRKTAYQRQERIEQWDRIAERYERAWRALEISIVHYLTAGEQPVGIEDFLKENGIV